MDSGIDSSHTKGNNNTMVNKQEQKEYCLDRGKCEGCKYNVGGRCHIHKCFTSTQQKRHNCPKNL